MRADVRILLLADTHLGFDLPVQPRVQRRRRGHDFLANYDAALQPARDGEVDVVVHGGDVFNRSHPAASVAYQAFEPLVRVADRGVPVFVVPGNHERGSLPHLRFARHPGIHVFDVPRTFVADIKGMRIALAGFPSERRGVRTKFTEIVESTGWQAATADVRLLCLHQCVEGSTVGPADYTFTTAADVIRGRDLPSGLAAVLCGHIHRHQVLTHDLRGHPLAAPVMYPGSIERTSLAEAAEEKGFMIVDVSCDHGAVRVDWQFRKLPSRPLLVHEMRVENEAGDDLEAQIRSLVAEAPTDAVLTIRVVGEMDAVAARVLTAANLRRLAPPTMNVDVRIVNADAARLSWRAKQADADALELWT